jgi:hypothetical protein
MPQTRAVCLTRHDGKGISVGARGKLAVVLAACVGLAGCGASGRSADAAAVAERFHRALERRDGAAACDQLAPETRRALEQRGRRACARAILDLELPARAVPTETSVYVTSAAVALEDGGRTFLDEFAGGWKVSASGCRPTGPNMPYDCELEG